VRSTGLKLGDLILLTPLSISKVIYKGMNFADTAPFAASQGKRLINLSMAVTSYFFCRKMNVTVLFN
jgi:hypothetical protein